MTSHERADGRGLHLNEASERRQPALLIVLPVALGRYVTMALRYDTLRSSSTSHNDMNWISGPRRGGSIATKLPSREAPSVTTLKVPFHPDLLGSENEDRSSYPIAVGGTTWSLEVCATQT